MDELLPPQVHRYVRQRTDRVDEIVALLHRHERVGVFGIGGSGKSTLAAAVAHRLRDANEVPVVWLDVGPRARPEVVLESLARTVGGTTRKQPDPRHAGAHLRKLTEGMGLLIIFDDVSTEATLSALLDAVGPGNEILITGRKQSLPALDRFGVRCLAIEPLDDETATAVLLDLARVPTSPTTDLAPWRELVRSVGCLPLAIVLLAGKLRLQPRNPMRFALGASGGAGTERMLLDLLDDAHGELEPGHAVGFARLGVFAGARFSMEAAASVIELSVDALAELVDVLQGRMLLGRTPDDELSLHPIVRSYAAKKLAASPRELETAEARYLAFYERLLRRFGGYEYNLAFYPKLVAHELEVINALSMSYRRWKERGTPDVGDISIAMAFHASWYLHWRGYWSLRGEICRRVIEQIDHVPRGAEFLAVRRNAIGNLCVDQGWVHLHRGALDEARRCADRGVALLHFVDRFFAEELAAQVSLESGAVAEACLAFDGIQRRLRRTTRAWFVISFRLADALSAAARQAEADALLEELITTLPQARLAGGESIDDVHARISYRWAVRGPGRKDPAGAKAMLERACTLFEKAGMVNADRVAALFELSSSVREEDARRAMHLLTIALEHARTIGDSSWTERIQAALAAQGWSDVARAPLDRIGAAPEG